MVFSGVVNYGPLTRLTLFYYSFKHKHARTLTHTRTQVNIEQDNIF